MPFQFSNIYSKLPPSPLSPDLKIRRFSARRTAYVVIVVLIVCLLLLNSISFHNESAAVVQVGNIKAPAKKQSPLKISIQVVITQSLPYDHFFLYQSKSKYALQNGYGLNFIYHKFNESRHDHYSRVPSLYHSLFPQRGNNPDWVFFMDHDILFMNRSQTLDSIIEYAETQQRILGMPAPQFIVSRDCNNLNIGTLLARSSEYTKNLLPVWYEYVEEHPTITAADVWHEQAAFIDMYINDVLSLKNHTAIVPQQMMNPFGQADCGHQYRKGDLLVHFPNAKHMLPQYFEAYNLYAQEQDRDRQTRIQEFPKSLTSN